MLETAKDRVIEVAKSVTPQESVAFMTMSLYGRENLPGEYEQYLPAACQKILEVGWLVYTQLMAEGLTYDPPKADDPPAKTKRKRAAKKQTVKKTGR